MIRLASAALYAATIAVWGSVPAQAETKGASRAQIEAALREAFPNGQHRNGQEGVMKIGANFRTVTIRTWQQCQDRCRRNPARAGGGCALWTFVKADNPKVPSVCRMWPNVPDLRANPAAVSGRGVVR
ncbi:MAG: hypothetical protein KIT16_24075 [Rhodospirillaceae bacterium]|nr:hypothetical protein [Rhodospirillaceae bacterium]